MAEPRRRACLRGPKGPGPHQACGYGATRERSEPIAAHRRRCRSDRPPGASLESARIAKLHEVHAGIRLTDSGVGKVLQPQRQLVLIRTAERPPDGHMISKVEGR